MSLPDSFLDELRTRIGLVQLVGRRVKLVRAGREWKGCCPFHNEKTPSFYVNEDKGFYHCFGCGAHGDGIRFLMERDGLPFLDAVRALADEAGLVVPEGRKAAGEDRNAMLRELVEAAGAWFEAQLHSVAGAGARDYLRRRGVPPALWKDFMPGFAPGAPPGAPPGTGGSGDALFRHLRARFPALQPGRMVEAGLVGEADERRYDRFRARLMFPIHDPRGRMVGFGGRILGEGEPKYLNSPEGPLFRKGSLLYNYHRAAPAARKAGRLLVVEGYMDVIGLAGAGMAEAVAPLGTALTEDQMQLCWRLVPEPVLAFDGDAAGLRAAMRAAVRALPLIGPGKSLAFTLLPAGQDPDDVAGSGGRAALEELLARALPLVRFLFDAERRAAPLDTPERRAAFRTRLKALAADIRDPDLRRDYLATWNGWLAPPAARAGPKPGDGGNAGGRRGRPRPVRGALVETQAAAGAATDIHMAMLLRLLAGQPELAERHAEELAQLPLASPSLSRARDLLLAGRDPGDLLSGYRRLSIGNVDGAAGDADVATAVAVALAQCLQTHQIGQAERQAHDCGSDQALRQAFERQAAAARRFMDRRGLTPAGQGE